MLTSKSMMDALVSAGRGTVVTDLIKSPRSDRTFNLASPAKLHSKAYIRHFGRYRSNCSFGNGKSEWAWLYWSTLRTAWFNMENRELSALNLVKSMMCSCSIAYSRQRTTSPSGARYGWRMLTASFWIWKCNVKCGKFKALYKGYVSFCFFLS